MKTKNKNLEAEILETLNKPKIFKEIIPLFKREYSRRQIHISLTNLEKRGLIKSRLVDREIEPKLKKHILMSLHRLYWRSETSEIIEKIKGRIKELEPVKKMSRDGIKYLKCLECEVYVKEKCSDCQRVIKELKALLENK